MHDFGRRLQDVEVARCDVVQLWISCNATEQITADEGLHRLAVAPEVHASVGIRRRISQPDFRQQTRNRGERWRFLFACTAILRVIDAVQLEINELYVHGTNLSVMGCLDSTAEHQPSDDGTVKES
jgi:hypothetical protein